MELIELVQKAQLGDREAFAKVCNCFEGLVIKYANYQNVKVISEDAVGEGWQAIVEAVKTFDSNAGIPFEGYALAKVRFRIWNLFKHERLRWCRQVYLCDAEASNSIDNIASGENLENEVLARLEQQKIIELISKLSEKQAKVVIQNVFEQKSMTEIAQELKITVQAVCNIKKRALNRLKKQYSGMYYSERG